MASYQQSNKIPALTVFASLLLPALLAGHFYLSFKKMTEMANMRRLLS